MKSRRQTFHRAILLLYTVAAATTIYTTAATEQPKLETNSIEFRSIRANRPPIFSSSSFIYQDYGFRVCYYENFGDYICESKQLIPGMGVCQSLQNIYGVGHSAYFYCGNVTASLTDPFGFVAPSWTVQYFATKGDCSGPAVVNANGVITIPDYHTWSNMTNTASENSDFLHFQAWITCNIYGNTTNPVKPSMPFKSADGIGIWVELMSAIMLLVFAGLGVWIFNKRKAAAAMPVAPFSPLGIPMVDI